MTKRQRVIELERGARRAKGGVTIRAGDIGHREVRATAAGGRGSRGRRTTRTGRCHGVPRIHLRLVACGLTGGGGRYCDDAQRVRGGLKVASADGSKSRVQTHKSDASTRVQ